MEISSNNKIQVKFDWINNVYGRIVTLDANLLRDIVNKFSVYVQNYYFMPSYKKGFWDGKIKFVKPNGIFYLGNFKRIYDYIKDCNYEIIVHEKIKNFLEENENQLSNLTEEFLKYTDDLLKDSVMPYKHQLRGALKSLYYKRGICEHVTSSGKSLTITLVVNYLLKKYEEMKILVLVPKLDLVEQLYENMVSFGLDKKYIGKYCGYKKDEDEPIIISTWQSICRKKELLLKFKALIVDECHSLKADVVRSTTEKMLNAEYRLGFTGTLPEHKADFFLVEGVLGHVLDKVSYQELQEAKQISDININILKIYYPNKILEKLNNCDYQEEKIFLENDEFRSKAILKIASEYIKRDKNVLILVKKIEHSENLFNLFKNNFEKVHLINGNIDIQQRTFIRHNLENSGGNIIIATVGVFSVGISIKRLHVIIFAAAGKSKIQTLQSVGRGLRLHSSKNILQLYDIVENLKFSEEHFRKRLKYYKDNNFNIKIKDIYLKE